MKNIRENIYVRFGYELFVGVITFISILIFKNAGLAAMALMALLPIIHWKRQADEREIFLFYKVGNFTAGAVFIAMVLFHSLLPSIDCLGALAISFFTIHGLSGLLVFSRE